MKNKILPALILSSLCVSTQTFATNGYQLIGIGNYQKGLAGAVTAMPGSAMTAISNPAGMARIGKRADFSLEMFMPDRHVDFTATGGEKSDSAATQYGVPSLGWTAPVSDENPDVYFGGGMYGTSGLGTDYPLTQFSAAFPPTAPFDMYFEGYSSLQFWQMAPTVAWNPSKKLSYGISLNIDYQSVSMKQAFYADTTADGIADTNMVNFDLSRSASSFGLGLTLGVLYDVNDKLTLGASYKSEQNFSDLEYQLSHGDIQDITGQNRLDITGCAGNVCPAGTYKLDLDFPQVFAAGIAYKAMEKLTVSFDVKLITWSDTLSTMEITGPDSIKISLPAGWDDQTIIALGVEYAVNEKLNLRAGYNHADAPIDDADTDNNYILPAVTTSHFAIGGDYHVSKYWEIGFHASKASEETLTSPTTGASIGLGITTVGMNLGFHF
ncbi:MAG: OmpP1/FadL family transporter [Gammaproteobacteria bacterium]